MLFLKKQYRRAHRMKLAIFGCGYVGLVTGAIFADLGHRVICVDIDEHKIANLQAGCSFMYEPGLDALIKANIARNNLFFTTDPLFAIDQSDLLFIAVGTPSSEDGSVDLSAVLSVANTIGQSIASYKLIINKSTVPVGTAEQVKAVVAHNLFMRKKTILFDVCSNPEFLKEGSALNDFMQADRIIIGTDSEISKDLMTQCYASTQIKSPLLFMSTRAAELTKYVANAMLATKISFINQIANIAECLAVDIEDVKTGIGSDQRIGFSFINPGCGYGGSCFPKDLKALIYSSKALGYQPRLLEAVEAVNEQQKQVLFDKLYLLFGGELGGKTIALWGLAFKPETGDMREASSRVLLESLWQSGAKVQAYDPGAMDVAFELYGHRHDLCFFESAQQALQGANALVICTEWDEFKAIDVRLIKKTLSFPIVIDGRNLYDPELMQGHGLLYYAIGRGLSAAAPVYSSAT